jgi:hypothetical protein
MPPCVCVCVSEEVYRACGLVCRTRCLRSSQSDAWTRCLCATFIRISITRLCLATAHTISIIGMCVESSPRYTSCSVWYPFLGTCAGSFNSLHPRPLQPRNTCVTSVTSSEYVSVHPRNMYGIILSLRPRPCRPCPACLAIV